jgi:hypothetical protein
MCLIEDQGPVEEFTAEGADEALADRVHPWCLHSCAHDGGTGGVEDGVKGAGEVRAAVTDQEPEARDPAAEVEGQVTGLLYRPLARRVGGDSVGDSDPMILPHYSYLLAGLIPQARVKIYPDSAHGFLFQHHAEFAGDVDEFLARPA